MLNIIKSDLYRIFKGKSIYIIFLIIILSFIIEAIGISPGHIGISTNTNPSVDLNNPEFVEKLSKAKTLKEVREIMKSGGEFELDREVIGTNANLYYFFIVIVVIVLCTDFSNKSIKNTLSSAITRKKYYLSKSILIFGLCTILLFFNNYGFYFINLLINGKGFSSSLLEVTKLTLLQLPLIYGIISLLISMAFLLKKTSTFNTIMIPFIILVQLIGMGIISLFRLSAAWFYNFEFQFALSKIVSHPEGNYLLKISLLGIFYMLLFHIIGYFSFKKTEIK